MRADTVLSYVCGLAFVCIAFAETFLPFRSLPSSTPRRWISNSMLILISTAAVACCYQLSGIALAFTMRAEAHGALNRMPMLYSERFLIGFAVLDLTAYVSHRLFHALAPMWRVHQVHHSEVDLDLTTGLRFHPVEALFTQGLLLVAIAALGLPPGAVAFAGFAFLVQDFFTHANLRVPETVDRFLRLLIITPALHRVHHSQLVPDQGTNFGTVFSLWDRLFGTYRAGQPADSAQTPCGLAELANGSDLNAARLLLLPFRRVPKNTDSAPAPLPVIFRDAP
jgi:sterol desaturase/sphingolipid hydroxylase (fatty acid hydroxylase superfamily)